MDPVIHPSKGKLDRVCWIDGMPAKQSHSGDCIIVETCVESNMSGLLSSEMGLGEASPLKSVPYAQICSNGQTKAMEPVHDNFEGLHRDPEPPSSLIKSTAQLMWL